MRALRGFGKFLWRFMVIFSFIVNFVLVVVLLVLGLFIFEIKNNVADPLIGGLHGTAVGLQEATIDWTIPVRDSLPIALSVPINAGTITSTVDTINGQAVAPIPGETVVRLTRPVPLQASALINLNGSVVRTPVDLTLPAGLNLPVALDLELALATDIPVSLDVRAIIPLSQTQLNDPVETLALLFEPLAIGLHNLPQNFGQVPSFAGQVLAGDLDLLATDGSSFNVEPYDPWAGYGLTAGLNYDLFNQAFPDDNIPEQTGLAPRGGIPFLDALIRPELYDENGNLIPYVPSQDAQAIPPETYNGELGDLYTPIDDE